MSVVIPPIGSKVNLKLIGYFGNEIYMDGTIESEPYQHGYNCKDGGWGLTDISKHGPEYACTPCFKVKFRKKRHRNINIIALNDIIECTVYK